MKKLFLFIAALTLSAGLAHAQGNRELNTLPTPENNQIVYRTSDHQKITLNNPNYFGVAYNDANSTYNEEEDYGIISFDGNITKIGDWAFVNRTTLTAVVWPSAVTRIEQQAFNGCTNLSSINLQEGVTSIGDEAFHNCAGITELTIPSTVTGIGESAFNGWTSLTKLTVKAGSIGEDA
ncbi:MAG: leucine-rich repeat protein, partial [Bacteroidales bacterium]|nr:leucine-rich repeat protein [Bacteroidales bacterium]